MAKRCINHKWTEELFRNTTKGFACFVFILLMAVLLSLVAGSWDSISQFGPSFLWTNNWDPVQERYGALVPIVGTLVVSFLALLIAVPASLGIAIFLTELAPQWLRHPISLAVEMLAAIPSIIYGMWGLFVFVPLFQEYIQPHLIEVLGSLPWIGILFDGAPFGIGLFTAGLVLAIMIIPFIASVMRDVFEVVPPMLKESAYGLGSTTWEVIWKVVVPYTKTGVIGGIMLGLGRALGETMAVTFVIGNAFRLPDNIFSPSTSIAAAIANEFNEAAGLQKSALIEIGLLLFLITTIVLACSRLLIMRMTKKEGRK
ncbi:phosphate ABC transporter permease subunit PstC [Pasteurellaceae bacterium LIM206]|nr:phosphate ABC transporter permease subunit PstC [Pasteurellaceae bacterium LIM206]